MRNPMRKLGLAVVGLIVAALLLWLSFSGWLGQEDSSLSMGAGMIGFTLLCVAGYFIPASILAARGRTRLLAGTDVVVRWHVNAADWERFRLIDFAATGVRMPALKALRFIPRPCPTTGTEIIVGKQSLLIDGYYFRFDRVEHYVESAHWLRSNPSCIALIVVWNTVGNSFGRWLLLLPVPFAARGAGEQALRHYRRAVVDRQSR